jgi:ubiquitin-protein ligase
MNQSIKRVVMDIKSFMDLSYEDKYIYFDKSNFMEIYLMIVGPKGTPYEDGMLFFKLNFSDKYPFEPPTVKFLNMDCKVRIHPNLYTNGKVCLSILGTWEGPKWLPTMSLNTIALTIQSILGENPLTNEPAYYKKNLECPFCKDYLIFCIYNKYKILLNDVIDEKFDVCKYFTKEINEVYKRNKNNLNDNLLSYKEIYGNYILHKRPYYCMNTKVNFNDINIK